MQKRATKFGNRFPWRDWLTRSKFTLIKGKDYFCRSDSMAQAVRFAARRFGMVEKKTVHVKISENGNRLTVILDNPLNGKELVGA